MTRASTEGWAYHYGTIVILGFQLDDRVSLMEVCKRL